MNLTDEQTKIIESTPPPGGSLLVTAFAGTGKTFTLQQYAEERPVEKILYAAYNKAIQLEAERKMPINVTSRTTHSLAYHAFGADYRKAGLLRSSVPFWGIAKLLQTNVVIAAFTNSVLMKFLASDDKEISKKHLTLDILNYYNDVENTPPFISMAQTVWEDMKSLKPRTLPMIHDGYLKLYQLSGPQLRFDYILLDEAQDTTPCVWDIMKNQTCRKIVVGDKNQQIYSWRGAIDALNLVKDAETLYLSKSFRFGPKIAQLATTILARFKNENRPVHGLESLDTEILTSGHPEKHTLIARGNMHIFRAAASECRFSKKTLGFVGGDCTNYRFQSVLDVYHVYNGQPTMAKDPLIKSFETFEDIIEYAGKVRSIELDAACQLVEEFGSRIPQIVDEVKHRDAGARFADLTYTTGHKAKGMEFPVVRLAQDFSAMIDAHRERPDLGILNDDEMNLLYVAITRATQKLYIHPNVLDFIDFGTY